MSPTARAVTDLVIAFVLPSAAVAGGVWLRRRYRPVLADGVASGSKLAYWSGTLLAAGGVMFLAGIGLMILVMKNW